MLTYQEMQQYLNEKQKNDILPKLKYYYIGFEKLENSFSLYVSDKIDEVKELFQGKIDCSKKLEGKIKTTVLHDFGVIIKNHFADINVLINLEWYLLTEDDIKENDFLKRVLE